MDLGFVQESSKPLTQSKVITIQQVLWPFILNIVLFVAGMQAYLYVSSNQQIVGFCLAEVISQVFSCGCLFLISYVSCSRFNPLLLTSGLSSNS